MKVISVLAIAFCSLAASCGAQFTEDHSGNKSKKKMQKEFPYELHGIVMGEQAKFKILKTGARIKLTDKYNHI